MTNFLLIGYMTVYLAIAAGDTWSDLRSKYAWWLTLTDLFNSIFSLVGMALFLADYKTPEIVSAAQYLFPVIVLTYFFVAAIDLYDELKEDPEDKMSTYIGGLLAVAFELPCLFILFQYSYK